MTFICVDPVLENNRIAIERLRRMWTDYKGNIFKIHGDGPASERLFKEWGESIIEKPVDENFILNKGELARLELEMKNYDRRISGKFINNKVEDYLFVPEGISLKDPLARNFYTQLTKSTNFERVNLSKANGFNKAVGHHMREAYIAAGLQGRYTLGVKHFKDIQKAQIELQKNDNIDTRHKYEEALLKVLDADNKLGNGSILSQFKELMTLDNKTFAGKQLRRSTGDKYDDNIYLAAKNGRAMLGEMGTVMTNGLGYLKDAVKWKYMGTNDQKLLQANRRYIRFEKTINEAISRIQVGMKEGGYLPSHVMTDLVKMKDVMGDYMNNNISDRRAHDREISTLEDTINSITYEAIPEHARPANAKIKQLYNEMPTFILQQYASDAIGFNKLSFIQSHYLRTMKHLSESKLKDGEWVRGMSKWIGEEFQIATEGLTSRSDWVNNMTRTLHGIQVVRTMGLNLTGAIVNATSVQFSAAHMGLSRILKTNKDYLHGVTGQVTDKGQPVSMRALVDKVETESGFLFNDVAAELVSEGLLPAKGINNADYRYDTQTGQFTVKGSPALDALKAAGNWTVEKSLIFHRVTENFTRKHMFRTAFIDKYNQYISQKEYIDSLEYAGRKGHAAAEAKAKDWALNFVNRYAFEYAIYAKPKAARGIPAVDTVGNKVVTSKVAMGAAGQQVFQLLHYPMSLMQQQSRNIRGGVNAIKVGQWDASEAMYLYRYAGLFAALQLGSVLTNLNLNGIMPNETLDRIKNIEDDFLVPLDKSKKRQEETYGLLSEVSGPTVGTIKWGLMVSGVLNTDNSYLSKVILGNVDFTKEPGNRLNWYQLNTEVGRWKSKLLPAFEDGRGWDAIRHYFRMYPGELPYPGLDITTRQARQALGIHKKKKARKVKSDEAKRKAVLESLAQF